MIDYENEVLTRVANDLSSSFPSCTFLGTEQYYPATFPCATGEEADNYTNVASEDSGSNDNNANVMYEFNVYSNKRVGKKAEARAIAAVICNTMSVLGFTRTTLRPFNDNNGSLYRIVMRFTGVIGKNGNIYRR